VAFGRRRREQKPAAEPAETAAEAEAPAESGASSAGGPWDAAEDTVPEMERLDFGSLQVPIGPGVEVQVNLEPSEFDAEGNPVNGRIVAITVIAGTAACSCRRWPRPSAPASGTSCARSSPRR
jgi:hypothetical protein